VNEKNADFEAVIGTPNGELGQAASEWSSETNFVDIFLAELGPLRKIVAGMGLSASDAEDILQDVSIRALKQQGGCRTKEQCLRWLIKVTVNRCLTEFRRRRRFRRKASEILKRRPETKSDLTASEHNVIVAEELEIVRECLQELDETLLLPMVLRYFCGFDSREVGEILAMSPPAVRSRQRKARMILANRLIERGVEP
jgi:RNA polymerase sigma-70 factor (ECF subfamily)